MMGGETGVKSRLGQGSTFWFNVRLQRGHGVMSSEIHHECVDASVRIQNNYAGCRVLLVEDNAINREVATELLYGVGLLVDIAEHGRIAVEKVSACHYDLILMDVQMPEMDGLTATKVIRTLSNGKNVPILAMTANAFDEDRQLCLAVGMNDFVAKPVIPQHLYATLLKWLAQSNHVKLAVSKVPDSLASAQVLNDVFLSQLHAISGLDVNQGIAVCRGDSKKYQRLLTLFASIHSADMTTIATLLTDGDIRAAQALTHELKGVTATLGAYRLCDGITQLNNALNQNAALADCYALALRCEEDLTQLIDKIKQLPTEISATDKKTARAIDYQQALSFIAELESMLIEDNVSANRLVRQSADVLLIILGADYPQFCRQIDLFNYDNALKILQQVTQTDRAGDKTHEFWQQ
jgi:CheY-like chemotaxis protein